MAIEVLGVEHIDLTVNDVARSRAFYDKVLGELGFRKFEGDGLYTLGECADDDCDSRGVRRESGRAASTAIAWDCITWRFVRDRVPTSTRSTISWCAKRSKCSTLPPSIRNMEKTYYAVFFADPDGMKLELVHYPWGYWRRVQTEGHDPRPRYEIKK